MGLNRNTELKADPAKTRDWRERSQATARAKAAARKLGPGDARSSLSPVPKRKLKEAEARGEVPPTRRRPRGPSFTPASPEQRAKVKTQGCRITSEHGAHVQPAHVTPRSLGGCDHEDCVAGLRADLHRLYDEGVDIGLLAVLTPEEQAHAVSHLGIVGALKRTTNTDWQPVGRVQPGRMA